MFIINESFSTNCCCVIGCLIQLIIGSVALTVAADVKPHADYTQEPSVHRQCVEINCKCGTNPRICDVDGGSASCVACPPGRFQPYGISSVEIVDARQCKPHRKCTSG